MWHGLWLHGLTVLCTLRKGYAPKVAAFLNRVPRKSVLQLAFSASCSWHVLAQESF